METSLVLDALNQAIALRSPEKGLIVHSDRGSQFASEAFRKRLEECSILQSMSRKGNCYDNAPMESFFRSFKVEHAHQELCDTIEQATREAADYIDRFYNTKRLHSSLGYLSPIEFEKRQFESLELCSS
jgi:transposase InsO family protein